MYLLVRLGGQLRAVAVDLGVDLEAEDIVLSKQLCNCTFICHFYIRLKMVSQNVTSDYKGLISSLVPSLSSGKVVLKRAGKRPTPRKEDDLGSPRL